MRLPSILAGLFVGLSLSGCVESGYIEVEMTSNALSATAPGEPGAQTGPSLLLTVREVNLHIAGKGDKDQAPANADVQALAAEDAADADADANGWITVFEGEETIDLLNAADTGAFLGGVAVPAGKVTQIRLVLAGDAILLDGDQSFPVTCPSCTKTGLKIVPAGKLEIAAGESLSLALDFDQESSLKPKDGGFRLDPVIKLDKTAKD